MGGLAFEMYAFSFTVVGLFAMAHGPRVQLQLRQDCSFLLILGLLVLSMCNCRVQKYLNRPIWFAPYF